MHYSLSTRLTSGIAATALALSMAPAAALADTPTQASGDTTGAIANSTVTNKSSDTDVATSTVTITGLKAGDTVTAYQIADADIDATNNLTYTFAKGLPDKYDSADELAVTSDGYTFTSVSTDAQKAASAIAGSTAFTGAANKATATAGENGTAQLTLGSGYYLVRVTNAAGNNDVIYQNILVNTTPKVENGAYASVGDLSITAKTTTVSLDKKSHENGDTSGFTKEAVTTFKVGDTVPFQVTTAVPSYPADAANAVFNVKDAPDQGLSIDTKTVAVKLGDDTVDAKNYTIKGGDGDGTAMTIQFDQKWVKDNPGASVTITYSANLTANAKVTKSGETIDYTNNKATVVYSPDTNNTTTTETGYKTVDVHTYGIYFQKVDKDNKALQGAEFTIYDADGNVVTTAEVGNAPADSTGGISTSDSNGYVWFDGLAAGTYTLKETKVPAGKQAVKNFTVTVGDDAVAAAGNVADNPATTDTEANFVAYDGDANTEGINGIVDPDRGILPATGDVGTAGLTIVGIAFVAGGIAIVTRARRKQNQE